MLEVAVGRRDRPEKIQEVLDSDVRNAIIKFEQETRSDTGLAGATASRAPRSSSTAEETNQPPATPVIDKTDNEPLDDVLLGAQVRPIRSPTFVGVCRGGSYQGGAWQGQQRGYHHHRCRLF